MQLWMRMGWLGGIGLICTVGCGPIEDGPIPAQAEPDAATFEEVATVFRNRCAVGDCHGQGGAGNLFVPASFRATNEQVRQGLDNVRTADGTWLLVEPGNPAASALYRRLAGEPPDRMMPPNSPLPDETVEMVRQWISAGANYEE